MLFENKVLRRIFGCTREVVTSKYNSPINKDFGTEADSDVCVCACVHACAVQA
jgi:hypothetical protein